jgi:hypothetical protein
MKAVDSRYFFRSVKKSLFGVSDCQVRKRKYFLIKNHQILHQVQLGDQQYRRMVDVVIFFSLSYFFRAKFG